MLFFYNVRERRLVLLLNRQHFFIFRQFSKKILDYRSLATPRVDKKCRSCNPSWLWFLGAASNGARGGYGAKAMIPTIASPEILAEDCGVYLGCAVVCLD